ncbi:hypothetical protein SK128_007752 [Halocaridina rubra]|uniref:Chitin-binding type-2 domain-containing protein n=1 Tax=Halocaridina rubra TaxID=373956 RepID=A0AAN8WAY0_HALRR
MASSLAHIILIVLFITLGTVHSKKEKKYFHCTLEGRFPDPKDCGGYIDCLPDDEGTFIKRSGSCLGRAYDPSIKRCVDTEKVEGCKPRHARALVSDPKLDYLCEDIESDFICADCKTLINCVNGTAYPEPCGHKDLCAVKDSEFGGGVCYPGEPEECACEKPNVFHIDKYDPSRFFFCEQEKSDPIIYQCPEDHIFDVNTRQCKSSEGLPECEKIGVFADPSNCTTYYTCIFSKTGWVQKKFTCNNETDSGLMFSEISGMCEDPCEWDDGMFECEAEGRFADPLDCHRYYECILDSSVGEYRKILQECPEGYLWDPNARNNYGHCVLEKSSSSSCASLSITKCTIPDDLCSET